MAFIRCSQVEFWIIYFWISTSWISTFITRVMTPGMRQIWAQYSSTIIINLGSIECDFSSRQERLEAIESIIWAKVANWSSHSALTTLHLVSKYPIKMADSTGGHHLFLFCTSHLIRLYSFWIHFIPGYVRDRRTGPAVIGWGDRYKLHFRYW